MTSFSEGTVLKLEAAEVEMEGECCCVCGGGGQAGVDLLLPEEHDQGAAPHLPPLRTMLLHLNHSKMLPDGRVCLPCAARGTDAYEFSQRLSSRGAAPLSDKIRALRRRLHELTQKIDVFIVVGGGEGGEGGYSEEDIIMVEREALAAAAGDEDLERAHNARGDTVYQCSVCPMSFQAAADYRAHSGSHPADAVHSCWTCGAQSASRAELAAHRRRHAADSARHCQLCGNSFQTAQEFSAHTQCCPATCPVRTCGLQLASRAALSSHAREAHPGGTGGEEGGALCPTCFLQLDSAAELTAHELQHRAPPPPGPPRLLVCGYDGCILRFSVRAQLLAHIRKCHGGAGSPPAPPATSAAPAGGEVDCQYCDRKFGSVAAMRRHLRAHRAELELERVDQDDLGDAIEYLRAGGAETEAEAEEVEYLEMESLDEEPLDVKPHVM